MKRALADGTAPRPLPRPLEGAREPAGGSITLVLPGCVTWDGSVYRTFRPYAELANSFRAHFSRVIVCTQAIPVALGEAAGSDAAFDPEVEVWPLPKPPAGSTGILRNLAYQWRRARALLTRMGDWELTYVFIPSYPGAIAYTANRLFWRRPMAVYIANDWTEYAVHQFRWSGWRRALVYPVYRAVLTGWEGWIMRSTPLALTAGRALLAKYGGPERPVYETVPLLRMKPGETYRREDTCAGAPVRLLFVGSLIPRKGLPVLLEALAPLVGDGRDLVLDLVGDGPDRRALEAEIRRRGLEDRVRFHGFVANGPELFEHYRAADVFVLPTYSEGFPRVLYEALGHSLPIVASAVSGIPHLLEDGTHAMLVPAGDPAAFRAALERVLDDGELRRGLIREGFALVQPIIAGDAAQQFVDLCAGRLLPAAVSAPGSG